MIVVDIKRTHITLVSFKKSLLGKFAIQEYVVTARENGWEQNLQKVIEKKKIVLSLPEEDTYTIRFKVDNAQDLEEQVAAKIKSLVPLSIDDLVYDTGIHKDEENSEVIVIAIKKSKLARYYKIIHDADAKPILGVTQSYATHGILKDGILEGEIVLYIDSDEDKTSFMFFDARGPLLSDSQDTSNLAEQTKKKIDEFKNDFNKDVNRIVLGGTKGDSISQTDFRKEVNILCVKAADIVRDRLSKLGVKTHIDSQAVPYLFDSIGLSMMQDPAKTLNLLQKDALMNLEEESMATITDNENKSKKDEDPGEPKEPKKTSRPTLKAEPVDEPDQEDSSPEEPAESVKKTVSPTISSPDSHFRSSFASNDDDNTSKKKKALLFIIVATLVAVIAGAALFFLGGDPAQPEPEPVTEDPTPTPTPEPELDRSELSVIVLNGSGQEGRAGEVAELLEDAGYEDVDTDNADSFDYEETVIRLKEDVEEYEDLIVEDLQSEYVVGDVETLEEDSEYDVVVIVGLALSGEEEEEETDEEVVEEETEE